MRFRTGIRTVPVLCVGEKEKEKRPVECNASHYAGKDKVVENHGKDAWRD